MSVETTNTVALISGVSAGLDSTFQSGASVNTGSEVFTATLKEQFQLLNVPKTVTPNVANAPTTQATGNNISGMNIQSGTVVTTSLVGLKSALQSSNGFLASQNVLPELTQPLAQSVTQQTPQVPVLQSLNTTLSKPNLLGDIIEPTLPSIAKSSMQTPVLESLNTTLPQTNVLADLAEPLIANGTAQPMLESSAQQSFNTGAVMQAELPNLAESLASNVAQSMSPIPVLQNLNAALAPQNNVPDLAEVNAPGIAQPKPNSPVLTVIKNDTLNQSVTPEAAFALALQTDKAPELSIVSSKPMQSGKKLEKDLNLEGLPSTLTGVIAQFLDVNNATSVATSQPQPLVDNNLIKTPDASVANIQDLTANSLVQAAILQPVISSSPNSSVVKAELNAEGTTPSPSALSETITPTLGNAKPIAEAAKMPADATSQPPFLTELKANTQGFNTFSLSDGNAQKLNFALDNLNVSTANAAALDAGIAKSLSGLASEVGAFDRSAPISGKGEVSPMSTHLYSPEWNKELGTKIVWMTNQNISSAELTLNPKHLGPISIHIDMQHDQASIAFTAQNTGVKEMLEASIPKLREMMQAQQLNLAEVNVSQNSFSGQGQTNSPFFGQAGDGQKRTAPEQGYPLDSNAPVNGFEEQNEAVSQTLVSNGLVSLYA
ncbi:MAG: flagellar hook-length control protein FliK [Methylococcales bacterium]